ncbi:50S ribosomal protein L15P [Methanobacterium lacus]|uniref:Large ribosomal subunit protein uL15 n=1 Tax=Methanobacterium lacus (strain AL-21) TaxID=877455 RepID=F0TB97_METLA|nr:uL15 family ribosomal protein [Methanobacterium lacus]ADZ09048.1 50S ribosomal protein L15P [Methanobacterium lacus]
MIRKTRKICKLRGSRTVAGGCSKKRRGAGNRGGKGLAGGHKHHWSWMVKFDPKHFGKYGFKRPQGTSQVFNPVNVDFLDENSDKLLSQGVATEEDNKIIIDVTELGYNKVLGKGKISKALTIKAPQFSKSAVSKIENAGGEALTL